MRGWHDPIQSERGGIGVKRSRKKISAAERELADRFREVVLAKRPILCLPDRVDGRVDPHHYIRAQVLRHVAIDRGLSSEAGWALVWNADNGVPVDRAYHDQVTVSHRRLRAEELRPENIAFAHEHGLLGKLAREVPSFDLDAYPEVSDAA